MNSSERKQYTESEITKEIQWEFDKHGIEYSVNDIEFYIDNVNMNSYFSVSVGIRIYYFTNTGKVIHYPKDAWITFPTMIDDLDFRVTLSHLTIDNQGAILVQEYNSEECTFTSIEMPNDYIYRTFYKAWTGILKWNEFLKDGTFHTLTIAWQEVSDISIRDNGDVVYDGYVILVDENLSYNPSILNIEWTKYIQHENGIYLYDEDKIFGDEIKNKKELRVLRQKMRKLWDTVHDTNEQVENIVPTFKNQIIHYTGSELFFYVKFYEIIF